MTHTPGPWRIFEMNTIVTDKGGYSIAEVTMVDFDPLWKKWNGSDPYTVDNWEANAHLIAAAPELLEACEVLANLDLTPTLEGKNDDYPLYELNNSLITVGDVRKARAVIHKARGKAP